MTVIADSSPLQYLILLEQTALLHRFYGEVLVPEAVAIELSAARAPQPVREWMSRAILQRQGPLECRCGVDGFERDSRSDDGGARDRASRQSRPFARPVASRSRSRRIVLRGVRPECEALIVGQPERRVRAPAQQSRARCDVVGSSP